MQVSRIPFPYQKTYTIFWNLWNFFLFSKNMDYHIQFLDFLSLFKKHGLSYTIFRSYYPFSKNLDYHIQFLEFLSLLHKRGLSYASFKNSFLLSKNLHYPVEFMEFLSLTKHGLSNSIFGLSFSF